MKEVFDTPFIVPVAAFIMVLGISIAGIVSSVMQSRIRAQQRLAMLAQGASIEDIERLVGTKEEEIKPTRDPLRSLANARRTGIVLVSSGVGLMIFFIVLAIIVHVHEVLAGAAAGLIPTAIGIGFFIDYNLQKRELSRFGLEVDQQSSSI
ncbi:MAG: hypothetical protein JSS87_12210 [Acidobacteria bacterium]|nr:hypothetical protein [Acidobacteriota bacterium]